jgi:hypothetical protein
VPWGHRLRDTAWSLRKTQVDACDVSNTLSNTLVKKIFGIICSYFSCSATATRQKASFILIQQTFS